MLSAFIAVAVLCIPALTEGCGNRPPGARVVNGVDASPHSWPWQISLRVNGRHICGGSLIKPDWVVTAAHCVDRNKSPSGYTVVVGAHVRTGNTAVQQTFNLKQLFSHEGFSMSHLRNDIALLQLDRPASLSPQVNLVCLPPKGSRAAPGSKCYITGWGRTVGGGAAADTLQQAELPVVDHDTCSKVNGRLAPVEEKSMICAGSGVAGQAGGCQGDSGGPFVCEENGKWVLRGAVSWGNRMCTTDTYTVFARVSSYIDWIDQKMSGSGGNGGGSGGNGGGSSCEDKNRLCASASQYCSHQQIQLQCPKTCGQCGGGGDGGIACADTSPLCPQISQQYCNYQQIKDKCPKTCGACGGGGGGIPACQDSNSNCRYLASYCSFHPMVRAKCKKTCRLC